MLLVTGSQNKPKGAGAMFVTVTSRVTSRGNVTRDRQVFADSNLRPVALWSHVTGRFLRMQKS